MNPNIRTVTDLTTIPLSVVQSGTLAPVVGNVLLLEYSGTATALDAILSQVSSKYPLGLNSEGQKNNLWIWDGTAAQPYNVTAWFGKFIKVDRDASGYDVGGAFNLLECKLFGYEIVNDTTDAKITFKPQTYDFIDPVTIDGTTADLTVYEFYNLQS